MVVQSSRSPMTELSTAGMNLLSQSLTPRITTCQATHTAWPLDFSCTTPLTWRPTTPLVLQPTSPPVKMMVCQLVQFSTSSSLISPHMKVGQPASPQMSAGELGCIMILVITTPTHPTGSMARHQVDQHPPWLLMMTRLLRTQVLRPKPCTPTTWAPRNTPGIKLEPLVPCSLSGFQQLQTPNYKTETWRRFSPLPAWKPMASSTTRTP